MGAQGSSSESTQQTSQQATAGERQKQPQKQHWYSVETLKNNKSGTCSPSTARGQQNSGQDENREVIDGVRRVWGAMKGCSCHAALSTLQR